MVSVLNPQKTSVLQQPRGEQLSGGRVSHLLSSPYTGGGGFQGTALLIISLAFAEVVGPKEAIGPPEILCKGNKKMLDYKKVAASYP